MLTGFNKFYNQPDTEPARLITLEVPIFFPRMSDTGDIQVGPRYGIRNKFLQKHPALDRLRFSTAAVNHVGVR